MFVLCLALWVLFNRKVTWEIIGFGVAVSAGVTLGFRKLTGITRAAERTMWKRFPAMIGLFGCLIHEIVRANLAVIRIIYRRKKPESGLTDFTAPLDTTAARVALADCITLTPGTITARLDGGNYTVHCLDRPMAEGLRDSAFVRRLQVMEKQEGRKNG